MPLVSVVVPTYDRADVLPRAIDSALAQTVDDLEVLVVDDASTDDTAAVIASYDDERVRSIVHETNRGANVARNTGIEHARGEYVAFLDSDDEWRPTKLERQLDALDGRGDDWVGAYCDFAIETNARTDWLTSRVARLLARADADRPREGGRELVGPILADEVHPGAGSTLLVRTAVARTVGGFDEMLERFQDPEFVLRVLRRGKLAYVDEPLVVRHETGSPSADVVARASEQYLRTYADDVARGEAEGYDVRGSHSLIVAKHYLAEGRLWPGACYLVAASVRPRHVPGLCVALGSGLRRRPPSTPRPTRNVVAVLALLALALFATVAAARVRDSTRR